MQVTIVGAGAIGGTVAAGMTRAGHEVTIIDREPAHIEAVKRSGLRITGFGGEFRVLLRALHPHEVRDLHGAVFLAVKSQHTAEAMDFLAPLLGNDAYVLSLQNGLNFRLVAERIGAGRTLGAMVSVGADYQEPGHIKRGSDGWFAVGELDGRLTDRVREISHALSFDADTVAHPSDNVIGHIWAKICRACLDVTLALTDMDKEVALATTCFFPAFIGVVREAARVARASGVRLEIYRQFDPNVFLLEGEERERRIRDSLAAEAEMEKRHVKKRTGYWRDLVVRKRKTEVDYINGGVEEEAKRLGLAAPFNATVRRLVHEVEEGRRKLGPACIEELCSAAALDGTLITYKASP